MAGTAEKRAEQPEKKGLFRKSTKGGNWDESESLGSWHSGRTWRTSLKLHSGFSTYFKVKRDGKR